MYILYDLDKKTILFQTESRIAMRAYLQLNERDFQTRICYTRHKMENPNYQPKMPVLVRTQQEKKYQHMPGDLWRQWEVVRTSIILMGGERLKNIRIVKKEDD